MKVNREQSSYEHTKSHDLERVIKNDRRVGCLKFSHKITFFVEKAKRSWS